MIESGKVLAIIAARGGSKGLKRKNIISVGGKPLVAWPICAAKDSKYVDKVIVSTDDSQIASIAAMHGAEIPFIRPIELADDTASSMAVVLHAIHYLEAIGEKYQYVVLLEPTSPFTDGNDIDSAIKILDSSRECVDSLVGIGKIESAHPEYAVRLNSKNIISPYSAKNFKSLPRRQDIEDLYFLEGSLYISCVNSFLKNESFYHDRTMGFLMPKWKTIEVDDIIDLACVDGIMKRKAEVVRKYNEVNER